MTECLHYSLGWTLTIHSNVVLLYYFSLKGLIAVALIGTFSGMPQLQGGITAMLITLKC